LLRACSHVTGKEPWTVQVASCGMRQRTFTGYEKTQNSKALCQGTTSVVPKNSKLNAGL
jgi:hypothetical protein